MVSIQWYFLKQTSQILPEVKLSRKQRRRSDNLGVVCDFTDTTAVITYATFGKYELGDIAHCRVEGNQFFELRISQMGYEYFMVDADDTLLNYKQAEINAINKVFRHIKMEYNSKVEEAYGDICKEVWSLYNLDNVDDEIVQEHYHSLYYEYHIERFRRLKMVFDLDFQAEELGEIYLNYFAEETVIVCHAEEICARISEVCKLIIITNGLAKVQLSRLRMLKPYIYRTYVSEDIGFIKPSHRYFSYVINDLKIADVSQIVVIGDSLSSDIKGAKNVGIDCCWYNPKSKQNMSSIIPTFEVNDLLDVLRLI